MFTNKRKRRGASILAALVATAALVLGLATPVQAASTDPYMTSIDDDTYTYVIGYGETDVFALVTAGVGPYDPTYFDSQADAESIEGVARTDDGLNGQVIDFDAYERGAGQWYDNVWLGVDDDDTYGAISFGLCNPLATGLTCPATALTDTNSASITVMRLAEDTVADVASISVRVYDPAGGGANYYEADGVTILSNTFYENLNTNYPSALDSTYQMWYNGTIPQLSYVSSQFYQGLGDAVTSMTVAGTAYPYDEVDGWMYGVYQFDGTDWVRTEVSKYAGSDVYRLFDGDLLAWRYGPREYYDLFFPKVLPDPPVS
ncbi:MAG: hypothetical protein LBL55_02180, partial [Propionibacteriaceae bacterium]|nr:hypothetical protein [Propionibacteriaceae bacterium]